MLPAPNKEDDCVRLDLETNDVTPEVLPAEWAMLPPQLFVYLLDATTECAETLRESAERMATDNASPRGPTGPEGAPKGTSAGFDRALAIHKFRIAYAAVVISLLAGYNRFIYRGGVNVAFPADLSPTAKKSSSSQGVDGNGALQGSSGDASSAGQEDMSFDTDSFLQYKRDMYDADDGAVKFMTVCFWCNVV